MEIHQLKYVVAVAQEKHFQKAADRVHISQPTLSQQIQKLEKELGVYLFERSPHHVNLTPDGERFLPYAISILDTIDKVESNIKKDSQTLSGRVSLGVIPTIGPYLLPSVIKILKRKAPGLTLELHDLTTSLLLEHLRHGKIQIALLALPINEKNIANLSIGEEPFYLAVAKNHPLAQKKHVTPKDFADQQLLVLQEGHCFREQSLEYCKLASNSPRIIFQGSSLNSVMRLTAAKEGVTFVPKMAALPKENPLLKFIPFSSPQPLRELGVIWRMSAPLGTSENMVINCIQEALKNILM
jgi:LysR family hydrogen peroxide-inducible transcriptional activator